jgi:hypothetical protein
MKIETFQEVQATANKKWHEYNQACKKSGNPLYKDLKKLYYQLRKGKKIIDINKVIPTGGVHENYHPKLAIAPATNKEIHCIYEREGHVAFKQNTTWRIEPGDIYIRNGLPVIPWEHLPMVGEWRSHRLQLTAPVPLIPPQYLPDKLGKDHFILWEVDEWKMVPPTDPWLLQHITRNFFVVLAGWDLTEVEKAAMAGRMV